MRIEKLEQQPYALIEKIIHQEENAGWSEKGAEGVLTFIREHADRFAYIGIYDDELVGMAAYEPEEMHLVLLLVLKEYRGRGYGTALVDAVCKEAEELDISRISANAASSALGFYESYGFEPSGEKSEAGEMEFIPVEYLLGRSSLGTTVTVTVDHPYGSDHPHLAAIYPVNFGYVSDPMRLSGALQDAWVIGPKEPVETFKGVVCAIVYHQDTAQSRFIVAPIGMQIDRHAIINAIGFEEQYYETRIIWADDDNKN